MKFEGGNEGRCMMSDIGCLKAEKRAEGGGHISWGNTITWTSQAC